MSNTKPKPKRPLCRGKTKTDKPCTRPACAGSAYCSSHGGGKRPIGRPPKLTRTLADTIADAVELGAYYEEAAVSAGITRTTLYAWREKGEADLEAGNDTDHAYFLTRLARASAAAEEKAAQALYAHRFDDWRAALAYLERRNPARWGKTERVEHSGNVKTGEPIIVDAPDDAAAAVAAILAGAGAVKHDEEDKAA